MWGREGWEEGGLKPLTAASSSSLWQEEHLPCCWAGPAWDHGWDRLPSKGVEKGDEQLAGRYKSRTRKKNLPWHGKCEVIWRESGVFTALLWTTNTLVGCSFNNGGCPSSTSQQSCPAEDWRCVWAQTVTQCLPRAVESSLLPFTSDLIAARHKKPGW